MNFLDKSMLNMLKFDDKGLIPAVVQHCATGQVLTVAYMNRESLEISIDEQRTCFFSRSRNELWRKGETSGNVQKIISITADCDFDALVVEVIPSGPACHMGDTSCFNSVLAEYDAAETAHEFKLQQLYDMLIMRREKMPENSYTTYLFKEGVDKILKKIGEECTEVVIGAKNNDNAETIYEISDLTYHIMVLMVERGITVEDIKNELASRNVIDKKNKQQKMS